jgi:hypothetical protein
MEAPVAAKPMTKNLTGLEFLDGISVRRLRPFLFRLFLCVFLSHLFCSSLNNNTMLDVGRGR